MNKHTCRTVQHTFSLIRLFLLSVMLGLSAKPAIPQSTCHLDAKGHLFLDDTFIDPERSSGIAITVNPPHIEKRVLEPDRPWEDIGFHYFSHVFEYEGEYRLYYGIVCRQGDDTVKMPYFCLATSKKGVDWKKPELGVVEYGGSKNNNLTECTAHSIFLDPSAPRSRRFVGIGTTDSGNFGITGCSADGIRFTPVHEMLLPFGVDTQNIVIRDLASGRYVFFLRGYTNQRRSVIRTETESIAGALPYRPVKDTWSPPGWKQDALTKELPVIIAADRRDWEQLPDRFGRAIGGIADVYNTSAVQYSRDAWLAFPSIYYHYQKPKAVHGNDGEFEVQLAVSRDGVKWTRYRTPYVARGKYDGTDMIMVSMTQGMIRRENELYQYFIALPRSHAWAAMLDGKWGTFRDNPDRLDAWKKSDRGGIYLAVQRVDGFVSVDAKEEGVLTTKPFIFTGNGLKLNVKVAKDSGELRGALADSGGVVFPGLGFDDCKPIRDIDSTEARVKWKGSPATCAGKPVRLLFQMREVKLYSFRFEK